MNQISSLQNFFSKILIFKVRKFVITLSTILTAALLVAIFSPLIFGEKIWAHQPFHSSIEAAGAVIALILAPLTLAQKSRAGKNSHFSQIASAMLAMGIFDLIHAISHASPNFYFSRGFGIFFGGILFSTVWLPQKQSSSWLLNKLPWLTGITALLIGAILLNYSQNNSQLYAGNPMAQMLVATFFGIGSIGFLSAALFFAIQYHHEKEDTKSHWVFANFCFLMTIASSMSLQSEMWGAVWWLFHFMRFSAYALVLHDLSSSLKQTLDQSLRHRQELEEKVNNRNLQLMVANQNLQSEISERKLSEANVQLIRGQLEATFNAMKDGVLVFDLKGNVVFCNQSEAEIHHTTIEKVKTENLPFFIENYEVYDLDDKLVPVDQWPLTKTIRGESFTNLVLMARHKGSKVNQYFLYAAEPVLDENGRRILAVLVTRNVTDLKKTTEALRQSELHFRQMANFLPQLIWETDSVGSIIYYNQRWYEFTGLTESPEIKTPKWAAILHPDDLQSWNQAWHDSLAEATDFQMDIRLRSANGQYFWHLARALPIVDSHGSAMKWLGTCTNIHEQKILLEKIKKNDENLTLITSATGIGTWDWDLQTNQVQFSAMHAKNLGFPMDTISADKQVIFNRIFPEDLKEFEKSLPEVLRNKTDLRSEIRVKHDDGSIHWMLLRGRVAVDELDTPIRLFGVSLDITSSKEIEEQLKNALKDANEANQLKSAFVANMSHEIRTPLGAILGFTDLLREKNLTQEEKNYFFEVITRNGKQLSTLINDILDLSKVEAGQFKVEILKSDFRKILQEVVSDLTLKAQQKNLQLEYYIDDDFPEWVGTDPTRLKQILINIISNAVKFTEKGFVHVHALQDRSRRVRIQVQDSGIGLKPAEKEKLFQPFSQADPSTTRKFGGTGLGLVLSRKLARALGGDLTILSSEPGVGSIFEITIENIQPSSDNQKYTRIYSENSYDRQKKTN